MTAELSSVSLSGNYLSISTVKHRATKLEQIWKTSPGKQQQHCHKKLIDGNRKRSHKHATEWYTREQKNLKGKKRKSLEEVCLETQKRYGGYGPSARDTRCYVYYYGLVGVSPLKAGKRGTIKKWVFITLYLGLYTYRSSSRLIADQGG